MRQRGHAADANDGVADGGDDRAAGGQGDARPAHVPHCGAAELGGGHRRVSSAHAGAGAQRWRTWSLLVFALTRRWFSQALGSETRDDANGVSDDDNDDGYERSPSTPRASIAFPFSDAGSWVAIAHMHSMEGDEPAARSATAQKPGRWAGSQNITSRLSSFLLGRRRHTERRPSHDSLDEDFSRETREAAGAAANESVDEDEDAEDEPEQRLAESPDRLADVDEVRRDCDGGSGRVGMGGGVEEEGGHGPRAATPSPCSSC